jgi:Protein of unknown function (DUF3990)
MPWGSQALTVYHGTVGPYADDIGGGSGRGILLARCLPKTDFGRGFYTTRILDQAVRFANNRYDELHDDFVNGRSAFDPECAAIVAFEVNLDALAVVDTLAFVQPTPDWQAFVSYCRLPSHGHKAVGNFYGAVYGPVSASVGITVPDWEQIRGVHGYERSAGLTNTGKSVERA